MANTVTEKTQLSNGVWVVPDGDNNWGGELNDNFVLLNGLLDRKTLTFTTGIVKKSWKNISQILS